MPLVTGENVRINNVMLVVHLSSHGQVQLNAWAIYSGHGSGQRLAPSVTKRRLGGTPSLNSDVDRHNYEAVHGHTDREMLANQLDHV